MSSRISERKLIKISTLQFETKLYSFKIPTVYSLIASHDSKCILGVSKWIWGIKILVISHKMKLQFNIQGNR